MASLLPSSLSYSIVVTHLNISLLPFSLPLSPSLFHPFSLSRPSHNFISLPLPQQDTSPLPLLHHFYFYSSPFLHPQSAWLSETALTSPTTSLSSSLPHLHLSIFIYTFLIISLTRPCPSLLTPFRHSGLLLPRSAPSPPFPPPLSASSSPTLPFLPQESGFARDGLLFAFGPVPGESSPASELRGCPSLWHAPLPPGVSEPKLRRSFTRYFSNISFLRVG